jgi:hypothetical protein
MPTATKKQASRGGRKAVTAKYTEQEIIVRDIARKLSEAGKRPLANPIRYAQARYYLAAARGTVADPFSEKGPLSDMTMADAKRVAREGGRGVNTTCIGKWRERNRHKIGNSALDNNRAVVCLALAAQQARQG